MKPIRGFQVEKLTVKVFDTKEALGKAAAQAAAEHLTTLQKRDEYINLLFSTGASQFALVDGLREQTIEWGQIHGFHLDEYKSMSADHPASFRLWLRERIEQAFKPARFSYIEGDANDAEQECNRYSQLIAANPIDLAFIGIGENGHIAFNDPPVADFNDPKLVKVVLLDEDCRKQQLGEGWFPTLEDVPKEALTLTIPGILRSEVIISVVPDKRKANAVKNALTGPITTACPASILRTHANATLYLDQDSASLLD